MVTTMFGFAVSMHEQIWKLLDSLDQKPLASNHATTFHRFPELPLEIRRMVWKEVCLEGRIIDVWGVPILYPGGSNASGPNTHSENHIRKFGSHNAVPPILHVSGEAREVGLKYHVLSFTTQPNKSLPTLPKSPPQIYVNFENDIICLILADPVKNCCREFTTALLSSEMPMRRIALPAYTATIIRWNCLDFTKRSSELQEIILYPAMTKASDKRYFEPAVCASFSPKLLSLDEAEERGLIDHTGNYNATEVLLDAKKHVHDSFECAKRWAYFDDDDNHDDSDDDDDFTPSVTINLMFLGLEPSRK